MHHHIPASPGPRVAGNDTIARVRGLRVPGGTSSTARSLVDDVNFDLRRGELLGVAGGRASGTRALARAMSGCAAHGETVTGGTVEVGGAVHRLAETAVDGVMTGVRLVSTTWEENPADAIRRALCEGVDVVVIDQTGDLPRGSGGWLDADFFSRAFQEHDAALVLVTDDLDLLRQTCDTVQVLLAGRIVERGPAARILSRPRHRYVETLLADRRSGSRWTPAASQSFDGCAFEPRCPVGRDRLDCSTRFPESRSFPSPTGSVTVKCHQPAGFDSGSVGSGRQDKEETQ